MTFGCLLLNAMCVSGQNFTVQINAGTYTRANPLVELSLPGAEAEEYLASNLYNKRTAPVQRLMSGRYLVILPDTLYAGNIGYYRLAPKTTAVDQYPVKAVETENILKVLIAGKPVFEYQKANMRPHADSPAYYARGGFIHPLYSPGGQVLTDGMPVGHAHQNGLFAAWVKTRFRNSTVDFWNRHQKTGRVDFDGIDTIKNGPVALQFKTRQRHESLLHGEILSEIWQITVYPYAQHFMFNIEVEQTNTTSDTLFIDRYPYGGMAYRGHKAWNPDDKQAFTQPWHILANTGYRDNMANNTHARWVSAWGNVGGKDAGLTIFSSDNNFRNPQAVRVHPTMPYWCYAPCIDDEFVIPPGGKYRATYRYLAHNGRPNTQLLYQVLEGMRFPPTVYISPY